MIWMIWCYRWKPQFWVQRRQSNNANTSLNTKTIESKHFNRILKRFLQTLSVCFVMPTSKRKYQCFLILVQSFSACTFSRIYALIVSDTELSSVWSYIFLLNGPDKKPKQNSSKTKRYSQQQDAKSVRRRTAVSQGIFFWRVVTGTLRWLARLHCLLYFLAFDWLRPAVLFFLNWTVCLFVKESPIWNYPN